MHYRDYDPPLFHARYGNYAVVVYVGSLVIKGRFPPRALRHLLEWAELREAELQEDWELARSRKPLRPIPRLE